MFSLDNTIKYFISIFFTFIVTLPVHYPPVSNDNLENLISFFRMEITVSFQIEIPTPRSRVQVIRTDFPPGTNIDPSIRCHLVERSVREIKNKIPFFRCTLYYYYANRGWSDEYVRFAFQDDLLMFCRHGHCHVDLGKRYLPLKVKTAVCFCPTFDERKKQFTHPVQWFVGGESFNFNSLALRGTHCMGRVFFS